MLFEVINEEKMERHISDELWSPREDLLESYITRHADDKQDQMLNDSVFGEELLILGRQVSMPQESGRADIVAMDREGRGVVIELKRNEAPMGTDMQALRYLADFSKLKGESFVSYFEKDKDELTSFLDDDFPFEYINKESRIILLARAFHPALLSMGEWLSSKGIAFRCISYNPICIEKKKFLNFSVSFDRAPYPLYSLTNLEYRKGREQPEIFWHNIGRADDKWWSYLSKNKIITTGFDGQEGDQGYKILHSYIIGDKIIAYASGYGAIAYGILEKDPYDSYKLAREKDNQASPFPGEHLHRIEIKWEANAEELKNGIPSQEIRENFGIYHPISTKVKINREGGEKLIEKLKEEFS